MPEDSVISWMFLIIINIIGFIKVLKTLL